ncbi:MAG: hypothetical protein HRT69_06380 [Flavobacteriaceae bacterium]|nr:hypothetical protein [Flavobacteriaceae bacterium]
MNIISYIIYLPIVFILMIKIGWILYENGEVFLNAIFKDDKTLVKNTNNILLAGYYLINLGFATITISCWEDIYTIEQLISFLAEVLGKIIITLAIMHYNNIFWLNYLSKRNIHI